MRMMCYSVMTQARDYLVFIVFNSVDGSEKGKFSAVLRSPRTVAGCHNTKLKPQLPRLRGKRKKSEVSTSDHT